MSVPKLRPRYILGLRTGVTGNAQYVTDDEVLYPVGCLLALHNHVAHSQRFIRLQERHHTVSIICLSPNRKLAAVVETSDRPAISLYDMVTLKWRKGLRLPFETVATTFAALAFSWDGRSLFAAVGRPDWTICRYNWEKGKVETTYKAITNNPALRGVSLTQCVLQLLCNPSDSSVVCVIGTGLFSLLSITETVWTQFGYNKAQKIPITCGCWLRHDRVLLGTKEGTLIAIAEGELRGIYKATDVKHINLRPKEEFQGNPSISNIGGSDFRVNCEIEVKELKSFSRGFAYICGTGTVHLFESDGSNTYQKRNIYRIPEPEFAPFVPDLTCIQNLDVNVSGDHLLATTVRSQLYHVHLWGPDITKEPSTPFKLLGEDLHHGAVNGLATCSWKPIFITSGALDRTIRVWNHQTERQEMIKQYDEEIFSVAIHPTGLTIAIGFSRKLHYMVKMPDDIRLLRYFPIRKCRECVFATNGHLFAAADDTDIHIYSCITYENLFILKGHSMQVCSLSWTKTDKKLLSCGRDNVLCEWDVSTGELLGSLSLEDAELSQVVTTADEITSVTVGADGIIRTIRECTVFHAFTTDQKLGTVALSGSGVKLFVSSSDGLVMSLMLPLSDTATFIENPAHGHEILRMSISEDESTLISCSETGTICVWKIISDGKRVSTDAEFVFTRDVLVKRDYLKELLIDEKKLKKQKHTLKKNNEIKLVQREKEYEMEMEKRHKNYNKIMEEMKERKEQMETDHAKEVEIKNNEKKMMEEAHEENVRSVSINYETKLRAEYDKYQQLEEFALKMKTDYKRQLEQLLETKESSIENLVADYEEKLSALNEEVENLRERKQQEAEVQDAQKILVEDDADREIVDLKTRYEQALKEERNVSSRLANEAGVMKIVLKNSQKAVDEHIAIIRTMQNEYEKYQQSVVALEKDVADLKTDISQRDNSIREKDKNINDLTASNLELEKFKFILNYKIEELRNQIEPKDTEIGNKKDQLKDMLQERENLQNTKTCLKLQLRELKEKLKAKTKELCVERQQSNENNAILRRFRNDLHDVSGMVQEPTRMKYSVKQLYHKYGKEENYLTVHGQTVDVQTQLSYQRKHLEDTVASLKRQVDRHAMKQTSEKRGEYMYIIEENKSLISEQMKLKKELDNTLRSIHDMKAILGLSGRHMLPKEAREKLQKAVATTTDIYGNYRAELEEYDACISLLKDDIQTLLDKLPTDLQNQYRLETEKRRSRISSTI